MDVKLPRIFAGEISPKYIGKVVKVIPIANPDINLDMYSSCEAEKRKTNYYKTIKKNKKNKKYAKCMRSLKKKLLYQIIFLFQSK